MPQSNYVYCAPPIELLRGEDKGALLNDDGEFVALREVVESEKFSDSKAAIVVGLGKTSDGSINVADLSKMPHCLIAGLPESGKSTALDCMIVGSMYKSSPDDVRFLIIDVSGCMAKYDGMPYLLTDRVICTPEQAQKAVEWLQDQMCARYNLFKGKYLNIFDYNEHEECKLPQIAVVIDNYELLRASKSWRKIENELVSLTMRCRAAGIYTVISAAKATADVISSRLKSNIPARISFRVPTSAQSRVVLDHAGGETLACDGDMLIKSIFDIKPIYIRGAYINREEVQSVVDHAKSHNRCEFDAEITEYISAK